MNFFNVAPFFAFHFGRIQVGFQEEDDQNQISVIARITSLTVCLTQRVHSEALSDAPRDLSSLADRTKWLLQAGYTPCLGDEKLQFIPPHSNQ